MRITGIVSNYTKNLNFSARKHNKKITQPQRSTESSDVFLKTPDKISRIYHKNGKIASETIYKNGKPYKDIWYDDNGKAQWVRFFDGSLNLSRNPWYEWKKAPYIELTKTKDGKTTRLYAKPAVEAKDGQKGKVGAFKLGTTDEDGYSIRASLYVEPDGTYKAYDDKNLPFLKEALKDLLDIISSDEYKDGFGGSHKFNNGVKNAIQYIEEKEQN